jgi:L-iditol 2-dehydrogenase
MAVQRALMAQQLGTVIYALKRFWSEPPQGTAVILGAGSAGLYFLQLLRALGFRRTVVADLEAERLATARALGADVVVDARHDNVVEAVAELTGGEGADLAIECAGRHATRAQAIEVVRKFGRVGCFGHAETLGEEAFPFEPAWRNCLDVRFAVGAMFEPGLLSFREGLRRIESGEVRVDYLAGREYPLADLPAAMEAARAREAIKVHIAIAEE